MSRRQHLCLHLLSSVPQVFAGDNWDFFPAVPVDAAVPAEDTVQPRLVEGNILFCLSQELFELRALVRKHLIWQPVLAFHQHVENLLACDALLPAHG